MAQGCLSSPGPGTTPARLLRSRDRTAHGFGEVRCAEGGTHIPLTRSGLADYLLSQSNAVAAIEPGAISAAALRNQIIGETAFFPGQGQADVVFGIRVWTTVRRA